MLFVIVGAGCALFLDVGNFKTLSMLKKLGLVSWVFVVPLVLWLSMVMSVAPSLTISPPAWHLRKAGPEIQT
jgi:hypothetical protein